MGKHVLDRNRVADSQLQSTNFTRIELGTKPHPASKNLQRRPRQQSPESQRTQAYIRIERGEEA